MTDAELERRFLDFVFSTDAIITTGAVAYFTRCTLKESEALLDRLTRQGTLRIENDEQGEIFYVYPNRKRLAAPPHAAPDEERALVPFAGALGLSGRAPTPRPDVPPPQQPVMNIGGGQGAAPLVHMPGPLALDGSNEQVRCPFCAETILAVAKKCKHCGELLDATLRAQALAPVQVNVGVQNVQPAAFARHPGKYVNPGVAALASLVWPGAGQMYAGRIGTGLAWGAFTLAGYLLIVPGLILHVLCMFSAASHARDENRKNGY
jgi:TM2 domain-containing membrane protein YozV